MAVPVKNIEKDYFLRMLFDEKTPVVYLNDRAEYTLTLTAPAGKDLTFHLNRDIEKLKVRDRLDLMFSYRGKKIAFSVKVLNIRSPEITCTLPDFFYKDLDRSFSRVNIPPRMQVQFALQGVHYSLSFPKVLDYKNGDFDGKIQNSDPKSIAGLIEQLPLWIKKNVGLYKLVIFKNEKPALAEEQLIAETGKILFLPLCSDGFPQSDPTPGKRIITEEQYRLYLESTGMGETFINNACVRFIKTKLGDSIYSDIWVPILFHEFVIGYIHVWNDAEGKPPFEYSLVETLYQFAKVVAYSLKVNGFFEKGKLPNDSFEGNIIDISASGLLFSNSSAQLFSSLRSETKLSVNIITPDRSITTEAIIARRFRSNSFDCYGCRFDTLADGDLRHLFECIYGIPFTDADANFLSGNV